MKRVACNYECQLFVYLNNSVISIIVMTKKQCLSYTKKTYAIIKRTIYNRRVFTEIDAMDSREKETDAKDFCYCVSDFPIGTMPWLCH